MDRESKGILVKFLGVVLLVASVTLLMRHEKNLVLFGLVVFAIALVVLLNYNLKKKNSSSEAKEKRDSEIKEEKVSEVKTKSKNKK